MKPENKFTAFKVFIGATLLYGSAGALSNNFTSYASENRVNSVSAEDLKITNSFSEIVTENGYFKNESELAEVLVEKPQSTLEEVVLEPENVNEELKPGVELRLIPQQNSIPQSCPNPISNALGKAGCEISYCESSWVENATGLAGERGWFQIHPAHFDSTYDPIGNIAAAERISKGGTDWSPWSVKSVLTTGICPDGRIPPVSSYQ